MIDKDTETRANPLYGEARDGPIMVSIDKLIKSRPGARVKPQPDGQRKPKPKKPDG